MGGSLPVALACGSQHWPKNQQSSDIQLVRHVEQSMPAAGAYAPVPGLLASQLGIQFEQTVAHQDQDLILINTIFDHPALADGEFSRRAVVELTAETLILGDLVLEMQHKAGKGVIDQVHTALMGVSMMAWSVQASIRRDTQGLISRLVHGLISSLDRQ